ncbi:hypothetical protein WJX73_005428 [Symbiochloris irregularis]|uniref:RanBD1 domain-containing protein n=1 Tax=Symbiochloris irregularis TaxID=706552 RepID=A0AAW1NTY6_9CHLO
MPTVEDRIRQLNKDLLSFLTKEIADDSSKVFLEAFQDYKTHVQSILGAQKQTSSFDTLKSDGTAAPVPKSTPPATTSAPLAGFSPISFNPTSSSPTQNNIFGAPPKSATGPPPSIFGSPAPTAGATATPASAIGAPKFSFGGTQPSVGGFGTVSSGFSFGVNAGSTPAPAAAGAAADEAEDDEAEKEPETDPAQMLANASDKILFDGRATLHVRANPEDPNCKWASRGKGVLTVRQQSGKSFYLRVTTESGKIILNAAPASSPQAFQKAARR